MSRCGCPSRFILRADQSLQTCSPAGVGVRLSWCLYYQETEEGSPSLEVQEDTFDGQVFARESVDIGELRS